MIKGSWMTLWASCEIECPRKHPLGYDASIHGLLGGHSMALFMINSAELIINLNSDSYG
jgi:hypothetical protein